MRDKNFLLAIILFLGIILSVGWYKFIYEPTQREILNMELETRRLREVEKEILELKSRHGYLEKFVATKESQLDEARKFLPQTLTHDEFIDELYKVAEFYGAQIISVNAGEEIFSNEIQSQVVNVRLETNYISLLNFIRGILDSGRLANLEKISVESSVGKIISCELSFKIFAKSDSRLP